MAADPRRLSWRDLGIRESDLRQAEGMAELLKGLDRGTRERRRSLATTLLPLVAALVLSGLLMAVISAAG